MIISKIIQLKFFLKLKNFKNSQNPQNILITKTLKIQQISKLENYKKIDCSNNLKKNEKIIS